MTYQGPLGANCGSDSGACGNPCQVKPECGVATKLFPLPATDAYPKRTAPSVVTLSSRQLAASACAASFHARFRSLRVPEGYQASSALETLRYTSISAL